MSERESVCGRERDRERQRQRETETETETERERGERERGEREERERERERDRIPISAAYTSGNSSLTVPSTEERRSLDFTLSMKLLRVSYKHGKKRR